MVKPNYWMLKAPLPLKKKLDDIRIERIKNGKDKRMVSYHRLGLAISRHEKLFNDLKVADLIEDKRAQLSTYNIFMFMIISFVAVLLFGGLIYAQGLIFNVMHDVGLQNEVNAGRAGYSNMTAAADITFGTINNSIQSLKMVSLVFILGWFVCTIIASALVRVNPLWFFAYILMGLLGILFSAPISNAYETILQSNIYEGGLVGFTGSNYILLHLPIFMLLLTVLGVIVMMINLIRAGNESNLYQ